MEWLDEMHRWLESLDPYEQEWAEERIAIKIEEGEIDDREAFEQTRRAYKRGAVPTGVRGQTLVQPGSKGRPDTAETELGTWCVYSRLDGDVA